MKKLWLILLLALLIASLAMTWAVAETISRVDLDIVTGVNEEHFETDVLPEDNDLALNNSLSLELDGACEISPDSVFGDMESTEAFAGNTAANDSGSEDFEIEGGTLVRYKGNGGDVSIPNTVTAIGYNAFIGCEALTGIIIPDSVTEIGNNAFDSCTGLTSLTIPGSVTNMGDGVFSGCTGLTNVIINEGFTNIANYTFNRCLSLKSISIPDSVTNIGEWAFYDCSSLASIIVPGSVKSIGLEAFHGCSNLASVTLRQGLVKIGERAFHGCSKLTSVIIPGSVETIEINPFDESLTRITIQEGVKCIGKNAFWNCSGLTEVLIPNSVTSIEYSAFKACKNLSSVTIGKGVTSIGDSAFSECDSLTSLTIPGNINTISVCAFSECHNLVDVALQNGVKKIDQFAFLNCHNMTRIAIPSSVTEFGYRPFAVYDEAQGKYDNLPKLTIYGDSGSAAQTCAEEYKIPFVAVDEPDVISITKAKITGIKDAVYTGKAIKPAPVVKYKSKKLVKGNDYIVKYANNKAVGTATVTIIGKGKYGESVKKTFRINPKAVALSMLTVGKQQLTVKWKKGVGITGYEVQYGLKKSFAGAKTVAIKKAATVKAVLKKLKTGKTYYVRVRAYKTVKGKKYYSAWSKAKSAKVK